MGRLTEEQRHCKANPISVSRATPPCCLKFRDRPSVSTERCPNWAELLEGFTNLYMCVNYSQRKVANMFAEGDIVITASS